MKIIWHEAKREKNLHKHGLDFEDAYKVFSGFTFTFEDDRYVYGDQRFVTVGLLLDVVIVHTETSDEIRVISMRRADKHEQKLYFENLYG